MNRVLPVTDDLSPEFLESVKAALRQQLAERDYMPTATLGELCNVMYSQFSAPVLWDVIPGRD